MSIDPEGDGLVAEADDRQKRPSPFNSEPLGVTGEVVATLEHAIALAAKAHEGQVDALHEGAYARHVTAWAVELAIILEDALMYEAAHVRGQKPRYRVDVASGKLDPADHVIELVFVSPGLCF